MADLAERLRHTHEHGIFDAQVAGMLASPEEAADRIEKLEACLNWYADQMCEGLCQGKDPKACANIGADNCAGCPAVVALSP